MPLSIDFKSGDKIIINGAVIENLGSNSKISVHNQAAILRGKEVLSAEDSNTPAARIYFALQCAYIFPQNQGDYIESFRNLLDEYLEACPSAKPIAKDVEALVDKGQLYKALKSTQKLIAHEAQILNALQHDLDEAAATE
ncbi:MAG: flagellar biosynthesis repressor FlbT [Rhodospirillaceae bacterium]